MRNQIMISPCDSSMPTMTCARQPAFRARLPAGDAQGRDTFLPEQRIAAVSRSKLLIESFSGSA